MLALVAVGLVVTVTVAALAVGSAFTAHRRAVVAAELAALAAADVVTGRLGGVPCEAAEQVASADGAALEACEVDGTEVTVRVGIGHIVFSAAASARAGPARP